MEDLILMEKKINEELYEKYKYYTVENVNTLGLIKHIYELQTNTFKQKIQYFNHVKFEGFYLIAFDLYSLNELKEIIVYFGKDRISLIDKLLILYYHFHFGYPKYHGHYDNINEILDEYCSVYDDLQKIKFIQKLPPELTFYRDRFLEKPYIDIKLTETEYKICEKFLLKQLKLGNIIKIEHYPKRGFLRRI